MKRGTNRGELLLYFINMNWIFVLFISYSMVCVYVLACAISWLLLAPCNVYIRSTMHAAHQRTCMKTTRFVYKFRANATKNLNDMRRKTELDISREMKCWKDMGKISKFSFIPEIALAFNHNTQHRRSQSMNSPANWLVRALDVCLWAWASSSFP